MKRKILLYGNLNLNIIDGSSIWLINLAKLLAQNNENVIDILVKQSINNSVLIDEIKGYYNINILEPSCYIKNTKIADEHNIVKLITYIDKLRDYSCMIIRGLDVVKKISMSSLHAKLIPYITDFEQNSNLITNEEKNTLVDIYNSVSSYFVQTEAMKKYLINTLGVDGKKYHVLNPIVFKDKDNQNKEPKSIVYAGKIANDWNIIELIDIMEKLYELDPEIKLHFIGDKVNSDLKDKKDEIFNKLNYMPNVIFYGSLSKNDTNNIIQKCKLGYSFRNETIDNDNSLEISVKLLEYCAYNTLPLLRETAVHRLLLGDNYPLFVTNQDECVQKIVNYFKKDINHNISINYDLKTINKNINNALKNYELKKLRLLINGHDLKFIKNLYPYFEKYYELSIYNYEEYMDFSSKKAQQLLLCNDIIWCEWLLNNASWFSCNIYPHQKLIIRAHRFELDRKYGNTINIDNIDYLVTVSYYYLEQFVNKFGIPREKVITINNYIDTKIYEQEKNENYKYNIALIGALPKRKGLDKAIDIIIKLQNVDKRYKLYVPGKKPEEFPNTWNDMEERQYYENVYQRIKDENIDNNVVFNGWVDIKDFLKDVGYTLSLSDKKFPESFHISPFECMASYGIGLSLDWEGIEYIYPDYTICQNIDEIVNKIIQLNGNDNVYNELAEKSRDFVLNNYDIEVIWKVIYQLIDRGRYNEN